MKRKKRWFYSTLGVFVVVFFFAQIIYWCIEFEIREEVETVSNTKVALVPVRNYENDALLDIKTKGAIFQCETYLSSLRYCMTAEPAHVMKWCMSNDFEKDEVLLLGRMISMIRIGQYDSVDQYANQLESVESVELAELLHMRTICKNLRTISGSSLGLGLLLYFGFSLCAYYTGMAFSSSLTHAQARFAVQEIASDYIAKRQSIDGFEATVIRDVIQKYPDVETVLDIPCGTGRFIHSFLDAGLDYYGADSSAAMVTLARGRPELPDSTHVQQSNILAMEYWDQEFDSVFVIRLLHHVPTAEERIKMFRSLRKKVRKIVVVSFFDSMSVSHLYYLIKHALTLKPLRRHAMSTTRLRRELQEAGLIITHVYHRRRWINRFSFVIAVPDNNSDLEYGDMPHPHGG